MVEPLPIHDMRCFHQVVNPGALQAVVCSQAHDHSGQCDGVGRCTLGR